MPHDPRSLTRLVFTLTACAAVLGCYNDDTSNLPCLVDGDCLGLKCVNQICGGEATMTMTASVAVGPTHACVVNAAGEARCWGSNTRGQLGYPALAKSECGADLPPPQPLDLGPMGDTGNIVQMAAGGGLIFDGDIKIGHTCVLLSTGRMKCWGAGTDTIGTGWLGYIQGEDIDDPSAAALVPLALEVRQIAAGFDYTCAVQVDGELVCWGRHDKPLGDARGMDIGGMTIPLATLQPLAFGATGTTVSTVSTGYGHACAVRDDGTVWCWGESNNGKLGIDPLPGEPVPMPTGVSFPQDLRGKAIDIHAGLYHTCAAFDDRKIACWGDNTTKQLGVPDDPVTIGTTTPIWASNIPAELNGKPLTQLVSGSGHNCVRYGTDQVHCWGDNAYQQLGGEGAATATPVEVLFGGASLNATQLASAGNQTCALLEGDEYVVCWGDTTACLTAMKLPHRIKL